MNKADFEKSFLEFAKYLNEKITDSIGNWAIKGFIDIHKNIYTISNDTKVISKILETHLLQAVFEFGKEIGYDIILPNHQNYYPDFSFVSKKDNNIKFAVDLKTTYRVTNQKCNGFTLGSHGEYFINRQSNKNVQFPYGSYLGHYCLGIIYTRASKENLEIYNISELSSIKSVIKDFIFFFQEKWKIAHYRSGSGNTANIGSITDIEDIINGNGIFANFSEDIFDEYWANYGKISVKKENGTLKKLTTLDEFLKYKNIK
jgi:hypothetical protein